MKKITIKLLTALLLIAVLLPLCACSSSSNGGNDTTGKGDNPIVGTTPEITTPEPPAANVDIKNEAIYIMAGETYELNYEVDNKAGKVEWSSSTDCATVENGVVTAVKEGYSRVSANGGDSVLIVVLPKTMASISVNTNGQNLIDRETYVSCKVSVNSENKDYSMKNESAGIRYRGNSTFYTPPKKPYRLKFDSKVNLLGMNEGAECKSWVLLAEAYDDSYMRDAVAYSLAASITGQYASDFRYVKLYLNGNYMGIFLLAEQTQINSERIDIEEAGKDTANLASGYLFEINGSDAYDSTKGFKIYHTNYPMTDLTGGTFKNAIDHNMTVNNDNFTRDQLMFAKYYMRCIFEILYQATYNNEAYEFKFDIFNSQEQATTFYKTCSNGNDYTKGIQKSKMTPQEAVEAVIDVESFAKKYLLYEIMCNGDSFRKSYFMWVDLSEGGSKKLTDGCPWDHDGAMVTWDTYDYHPTEGYFDAYGNVWHLVLMCNDWFVELVEKEWQKMYADNDGFGYVLDMINAVTDAYEKDFEKEHEMWSRQYKQRVQAEITHDWLEARIAWINHTFGE